MYYNLVVTNASMMLCKMFGMTHAELTHWLSHEVGSLSGWIKRPDAVDCSTGDVPFLVLKAKSRENGVRCLTCYIQRIAHQLEKESDLYQKRSYRR